MNEQRKFMMVVLFLCKHILCIDSILPRCWLLLQPNDHQGSSLFHKNNHQLKMRQTCSFDDDAADSTSASLQPNGDHYLIFFFVTSTSSTSTTKEKLNLYY